MNGYDRRAVTACPWIAARDSLYTRVRVVGPAPETPDEQCSPGGSGPVDPDVRVLALVRPHGHPLGLAHAIGDPGGRAGPRRAPVAAAHRELTAGTTPVTTGTTPVTAGTRTEARAGPPGAEGTGS